MKKLIAFCCVGAMFIGCGLVAIAQETTRVEAGSGAAASNGFRVAPAGVELLSDTQGVDFKPYLKTMMKQVYWHWAELMPREARSPRLMKGETQIRFTIRPDGTIAAMHVDESAVDDALNRAAWGAISGVGKFAALPSAFHGQGLELRIHFIVNDQDAAR